MNDLVLSSTNSNVKTRFINKFGIVVLCHNVGLTDCLMEAKDVADVISAAFDACMEVSDDAYFDITENHIMHAIGYLTKSGNAYVVEHILNNDHPNINVRSFYAHVRLSQNGKIDERHWLGGEE